MNKWWSFGKRRNQELDEEIQAHLAMAKRDRMEQGQSARAAELAARREFGNRTLVAEVTRDMWGWRSVETLWQDVRYGLRMMRRNPGFTTVAVLSLALGIGANTAIFSLINALMLRTLPVQSPEQLVELLQKYPGEPRSNGWTPQSFEHFRDRNHVFSGVIASTGSSPFPVRGEGGESETVNGAYVDGDFFPLLGLKPAIGRLIGPGDSDVAVVSWRYWDRKFRLDPGIVGTRIVAQDRPVTIAGVTPRAFSGLQAGFQTDIWLPRSATQEAGLVLLGRLRPGVSINEARAEMAVLYQFTIDERVRSSDWNSTDPLVRQLRVEVEPAGAGLSNLRDYFAKPLLVLMALVALLLLIACTNVASLLLARGAARQREMALRAGLGASRMRVVRQVLTESLLLSGAGSFLGIFLAYFGARALVRMITSGRRIIGLPPQLEIPLDPDAHMLLFTGGIALFAAVLFGLAPAWHAFTAAPASSLRQTGRGGDARFQRLFGRGLVVAQVAVSVVLLSTAGLFVGHLANLRNLDLGFLRDHVLLVSVERSGSGYSPERLSAAYQELLPRLEAIPGVRLASFGSPTPVSGAGASRFITAEGRQERAEDRRYVALGWVAPRYFETLGTPLLAGRDFTLQDQGRTRIAIVNQAMADYYFPGDNPIGKHFTMDGEDMPYEIVGMVGNAKYYEIREAPQRTIYLRAFRTGSVIGEDFALRTTIDPAAVAGDVRRAFAELLPAIGVRKVTTLEDQVDATIVPERVIALLSGVFGALGSLLAAIGLYGLLAYMVARRVNEIGIRVALGATRGAVVRMVLGDAAGIVCVGLAIGVPIAYWGAGFAGKWIQDLQPEGISAIAFGALGIVAITLLAACLPALRASRVDPMDALRHE